MYEYLAIIVSHLLTLYENKYLFIVLFFVCKFKIMLTFTSSNTQTQTKWRYHYKNFPFFMALAPIHISLSTMVVKTKKGFELVSNSYIATFGGGVEKVLNKTEWKPIGLRKEADGSVIGLHQDTCCLYFKDWSKNPTLGSFDKNYPLPLA